MLGRLISFQYANLLQKQSLPVTPATIFNPAASCGQYLRIDSLLQSNKLLHPLVRQLRLTLHFDYNQLSHDARLRLMWKHRMNPPYSVQRPSQELFGNRSKNLNHAGCSDRDLWWV